MRVSENLSILFLLEKSEMDKDGRAPIYVRLSGNGPRREMSLGIKTSPNQWNQQAGLIEGSGTEIARMNKLISKTKAKLEQIELVLSAQYEFVSPEMVKKAYKESALEKGIESEKLQQKTLCQTCNYKYSKFACLVKTGERSENTLKRWCTTKRKIREFLKYKFKKWDVPLSAIKYAHANDFLHFLLTKQGMEENTASKYLKNTRELLQIAEDQEWITKNPWNNYKIKYVQPERECLTMLEIITLYQKPLLERLDHVRNIFLFACFTGYAFQEVMNFTKDDIFIGIDSKRWIKIDRQKTGNPECIPLLPIPASIVDRYTNDPYCIANNKLLPVKSYHNYNSYLKEVAYICEIPMELSTHIARHTFATTICLDHDVPIETVSKMLGHKNIRTTQIYAKVSKKKISNNMSDLEKKLFTPEGLLKVEIPPIFSVDKKLSATG